MSFLFLDLLTLGLKFLNSYVTAKLTNIYGKSDVPAHSLDKYQEITASSFIRPKTFVHFKGFK